eukprot:TRINITY_DN3359_c0_g1_i2.p3 TRINITY_DN3359_c0_g1~~TRINITY_DN3359_c0_g1_i2.p3  ORF type:complete len:102 (+),score=27.47 TRINITY_DN3359_c0_g1_i2:1-306(+)
MFADYGCSQGDWGDFCGRVCVVGGWFFFFFFFKQKTAYEMQRGLVGSEMCIRDRRRVHGQTLDFQYHVCRLVEQTSFRNTTFIQKNNLRTKWQFIVGVMLQ